MPRVAAILVLKDGTVFRGTSIGAEGMAVGEVVFNTAMTGYQEILTDPSYCRQLVTLLIPTSATPAPTRWRRSAVFTPPGSSIRDLR